mmetsp:Transcript_44041/g.141222  ORF Transcript_44041/g.141222 Transcript_44041/m.141222 type:complete len:496 (-) Transcript_44041:184-1671(-)
MSSRLSALASRVQHAAENAAENQGFQVAAVVAVVALGVARSTFWPTLLSVIAVGLTWQTLELVSRRRCVLIGAAESAERALVEVRDTKARLAGQLRSAERRLEQLEGACTFCEGELEVSERAFWRRVAADAPSDPVAEPPENLRSACTLARASGRHLKKVVEVLLLSIARSQDEGWSGMSRNVSFSPCKGASGELPDLDAGAPEASRSPSVPGSAADADDAAVDPEDSIPSEGLIPVAPHGALTAAAVSGGMVVRGYSLDSSADELSSGLAAPHQASVASTASSAGPPRLPTVLSPGGVLSPGARALPMVLIRAADEQDEVPFLSLPNIGATQVGSVPSGTHVRPCAGADAVQGDFQRVGWRDLEGWVSSADIDSEEGHGGCDTVGGSAGGTGGEVGSGHALGAGSREGTGSPGKELVVATSADRGSGTLSSIAQDRGPTIETEQVAQQCTLGPTGEVDNSSTSMSAILEGMNTAVEEGMDRLKASTANLFSFGW